MAKEKGGKVIVVHEKEKGIMALLDRAVDKEVPVEALEKLIALHKDVKAELARDAFNEAMSAFQGDCPVIEKTKEARNGNRILYKFAGLDSIVNQVREHLTRNGLSYSMKVETKKDSVKVTCVAKHVAGHTEQSSFDIPLATKTGMMSAPQQFAATATFAKRYAFLDVFGIMTGDEDTDGAEMKNFAMEKYEEKINKAKTIKQLKAVWMSLPGTARKSLQKLAGVKKKEILTKAKKGSK